jgi:hypothetical protein
LARRGITHLLEHLVLHPMGTADYHYNGSTGSVVTSFHLQGTADDVAAFLAAVCRFLRDPPVHRLSVEKDILRTERSSRTRGVADALPLWRYGARGYGLPAYPEWGVHAVSEEELLQWAAAHFTRDNAVLWIAGDDVPAGLRLDLPSGRRVPLPAPTSALPATPAYFMGGSHATALDAVVTHRPAGPVFASVLQRQLFRALRQEGGLSYTTATDYDPRGDGFATLTALADALPGKQDAVLGGFLDLLAAIRAGRIPEADLAAVQTQAMDELARLEADAARLPAAAFGVLTGRPVRSADELAQEVKAVTAADVHEVATEAMAGALLMTPAGTTADGAGFAAAPNTSSDAVEGRTYCAIAGPERLVVGEDGVSVLSAGGEPATVRFDRCVVMLAFPDGGRYFIGDDGLAVAVEPTLFRGADRVRLDERFPADRRVDLPARDPDQIPRPARRDRRPMRELPAPQRNALVLVGLIAAVTTGPAAYLTGSMIIGTADHEAAQPVAAWLIAAVFELTFGKHWRRLRRRW